MKSVINEYWGKRLETCREALIKNNFSAYIVKSLDAAGELVLETIIPEAKAKTFAHAGSLTVEETGIFESIRKNPELEVLETFNAPVKSREEMMELARHALLADMFITGTNAITETGILVNLDMWGNRVGAMAYGPKNVVIITGRNKLVAGLTAAMDRVKNHAAPLNTIRHNKEHPRKTPCVETSFCNDCSSEWRICNTWIINEKSFPKGRIKVILINEDLGL